METAPLVLEETNEEQSTEDGCTWRSLCSALHAAEPFSQQSRFRACSIRIRKQLAKEDELKDMQEFANRVGSVLKTSLFLSKVSCDVVPSQLQSHLFRNMPIREMAMQN